MKFFPTNVRIHPRNTALPTNPPLASGSPQEPTDAKEIWLLSSGLLILALGIGGILMYTEEEPPSATASHLVEPRDFAKAFSSPLPKADQTAASSDEAPTFLPEAEAHAVIGEPVQSSETIPPATSTLVNFDFSQALLTEEGKTRLATQIAHLPMAWEGTLRIQGHTDTRGSESYNRALGAKRAEAVKTYLVSLGIPQDRIQTDTFGKDAPLCLEDTPSCHDQNRRAHVEWVRSATAQGEEPVLSESSSVSTEISRLDPSLEISYQPVSSGSEEVAPSSANEMLTPAESTLELVTPEVVAHPEAQP